MLRIMLCVATTVIVATSTAPAEANVCSKAYSVRVAVVKKFGKRAPGRNVCRFGIKHSNGKVSPARYAQKKRYLLALRNLNRPPVTRYVRVAAVPPRQAPAGTMSPATRYVGGGNYAIPRSIVMCESRGDYDAVNPSSGARGAYQLMPSTYSAYGGDGSWSRADQDRVAARVWAGQGRGAWSC